MSFNLLSSFQVAPAFKITVNGAASTATLNDRLISISVTLNNGEVSDQLTLVFDDRANPLGSGISLPTTGVKISVSLGYENNLVNMGDFIVNHITLSGSGSGRTLNVSATPSLLNSDRSLTWANKSIEEIVNTIASKYKLKGNVSPSLKSEKIEVINQYNESDAAFLMRLSNRYNAVCKPMAGKLLFMVKGQGTSASGEAMAKVSVSPQDILDWHKTLNEQQEVAKVCAYWHDYINAKKVEVYVPPGEPLSDQNVLRLPHVYNNQAEAIAAAKAEATEVNREDESLTLTMIGNPNITAERAISLSRVRNSVDGDYIVKSATHSFSQGGYQTSVQAYAEPKAF